MPRFTQALTRHPVGDVGSGEAERSSPRSRASRSARKDSSAAGSFAAEAPAAKWLSMACSSWIEVMNSCYKLAVAEGVCSPVRLLCGGDGVSLGKWMRARRQSDGFGHCLQPEGV